jgi:putative peptide zinc metalloprotease protein
VKVLAILALVVPVGGIIYLLARMIRSYAVRTWTHTRGKPVKRGLAAVVSLAMLGGLAYAWYPGQGTYRPIQPYERGTVQDAVAGSPLGSVLPGAGGLRVGEQRSARTIWPKGTPLPTADHPVVALVLTPKDTSANLPTWVFPFDRPAPPRPGDNQAMSIVTKDGGTAYDAAFALVWADGNTVLNANQAYAFASCAQCEAVAIAFQVVLVVGDANIVAPQNVAEAISYNCISCVTAALAVQLVVTIPDKLSDQAMAQLQKLWAEIMQWSKHLKGLTFAQIQAQLEKYEKQILAIVRPELVGVDPSASPSPHASATDSPGAAGSGTSAPGATPTVGPGTVGGSTDPSASASPSDSPSPSSTDSAPATTPSPTGTG